MEIQLKRTIKAGNSSAVVLPRSWLNREVRVELIKKTPNIILLEVLEILKDVINTKEIIGIYLTGSYAREEEEDNSDIDILVITKNIDKELIKLGIYSILVVSSNLLKQKMENDLLPIGPMISEAKPLLNSTYLDSIKIEVTRKNVKWYLDTTKEKIELINEIIEGSKNKKHLSDRIAYTLVLRIRTLYLIEKLIKNKSFSKKEFRSIIESISKGVNAYEGYLSVKDNKSDKKRISLEEVKRLNSYLKDYLEKLRKL